MDTGRYKTWSRKTLVCGGNWLRPGTGRFATDIEKEMKEGEAELREAMDNPIPFRLVLEDLERRLGEVHGQ
jgi:hypothetical protein